jgi:hypothetical protein
MAETTISIAQSAKQIEPQIYSLRINKGNPKNPENRNKVQLQPTLTSFLSPVFGFLNATFMASLLRERQARSTADRVCAAAVRGNYRDAGQ